MAANNQKGFIGRKALLLMSLTFSFITFCLFYQLMPTTNTITKRKSETVIKQANHNNCLGDKQYKAYSFAKANQDNLSTSANSDLDPRVIKRFAAAQQELEQRERGVDIKITFNWGRANPWPIPKFTNNSKYQPNKTNQNK